MLKREKREEKSKKEKRPLFITLPLVVLPYDTEEMEDELSASGFNTPREWAYLFSIGFYGKGKFVLEMKFNHILGKMREMGTNETKLFSSTSSLNFGYNFLYKNDMLALYPYIGSGFGKFSILLKL